jgi:hypothetical protein
LYIQCFCIFLCSVSSSVCCCLLPFFVQVYRPLPPGGNPIAANGCHIKIMKPLTLHCITLYSFVSHETAKCWNYVYIITWHVRYTTYLELNVTNVIRFLFSDDIPVTTHCLCAPVTDWARRDSLQQKSPVLSQNADFSSQRASMQRSPSTLGDLQFNPFSLPLFHSGNMSWLFLFLLPSVTILLFVFLLHLLCLPECLFPPLLHFSAEFSYILLRSLGRLALSLSSFLLFIIFLSSFLPYFSATCSCYWSPSFSRFRTVLSDLKSHYFPLTILCGTFPWYYLIRLLYCFFF